MKIIPSKVEPLIQKPGLLGIYEAIETAGRTCYKSVGTRYFSILREANMDLVEALMKDVRVS